MLLTLRRPDDMHVHLRDGAALASVVPWTARTFGRAIVMPNLKPPVTTVAQAAAYRDRILAAVPAGASFEPLMTLYLTDATTPATVQEAADCPFVHAFKLYPVGVTTHAEAGVTDLVRLGDTLAAMERLGVPLLLHGEVPDADVDVFDRERVFLDRSVTWLLATFPALRMVVEHITTREAVDLVTAAPAHVAATITPQHLLLNRSALFQGGLRPHHYCLPVLKREEHRLALLKAATSGNPKFFLGTDSAPHPVHAKESACGCAGCFTAPHALALYATAFERAGALDRLDDFAGRFGAAFYGLSPSEGTVTLMREAAVVPERLALGPDEVVPLFAGEVVPWRLAAG